MKVITKFGLSVKKLVSCMPFALVKKIDQRLALSMQYIKGQGLEIGALHCPLPVINGVHVKNVDLVSQDENVKKYPELDASKIVTTDLIDDGFVLSTIPDSSQDFLIANHVLEHAPNPIQVLVNWARVIKPNGILFFSIPIAEECFDKGRALTKLSHLIDDFRVNPFFMENFNS